MAAISRYPHLAASTRVQLWRAIDGIIRADPTCASTFKVIRSFEGRPVDKQPLGRKEAPSLELTPRYRDQGWWSTDAQVGTLQIGVLVIAEGTNPDDADRLYYAVQRALWPATATARQAVWNRLKTAGAHRGTIEFFDPVYDDSPGDDDMVQAVGGMRLEYRDQVPS